MASDGSVVVEAILDASKVKKGVKDVNSALGGVSWKGIEEGDEASRRLSDSLKTAGAAATVGLTAPIVAAGTAALGTASSYEQVTSRIQAALGVTADEAERLGEVGESIYEGGFGASIEAVDDALVTVRQNLGELNDADLAYVTQAALTLSDVLGMDVGESVRGVDALMTGFGLSAQDAMDLFVAGAQDGLNYSGELGDNLAEYGPRFAQMGFSAEEYFSILKAGSENGAYSLDKVNDFLNEFQTSLSDGRMDEQIGKFSQSTQGLFESWKTGGATGRQVFEAVMGELARMPDGYEKAQLASELWSSLGEDNAMGMITSLAGVEDAYGDVSGAAEAAGEAASDSFAAKAEQAMRTLAGSLEPFGEPLLNIAQNVAEVVTGFGEWFSSLDEGQQTAVLAIAGIAAAIGPVLSLAGTAIDGVSAIGGALDGLGGIIGGVSGAAEPAAEAVDGLGAAGGSSATQILAMAAAVVALGAGILLASAGMWVLVQAATQLVTAGPMAAVALAGLVAIIAGLAAGAAYLGPALSAGAVGMVAFGAAVLMVGAGIALATAGIALLAGQLPTISAYGLSAAAGVGALGAALVVLGTGAIVAGAGIIVFGAGVLVAAAGVGVFGAALGVVSVAVTALGAGMTLLASAVMMLGVGVLIAANGFTSMAGSLPTIASSAPLAAAGLTALSAAAGASALGVAAVSPALSGVASSASTAAAGCAAIVAALTASAMAAVMFGASATTAGAATSAAMAAAGASVTAFGASSSAGFRSFTQSAAQAGSEAAASISQACSKMRSEVSGLRLRLPRIEVGALPHFSLRGTFDPQSGAVPSVSVSWYAKGGIFNGASIIGVGEAGTEAVVPYNKRGIAPIAEGVADELAGGDADTAALLRQLIKALPGIIRRNAPRTIEWKEREVARIVKEVL